MQQRVCFHRAAAGTGLRRAGCSRGAGRRALCRRQRSGTGRPDCGRHELPGYRRRCDSRRGGCPSALPHGTADADHLRLQQGQPDGACRFRRDQRRRGDQRRVAEGVFPLLLRRGSGRGDLCETAGRGGLHHRLGPHQRRGRQCVQHAEPVHCSGRRPDRLCRFPVCHPAAGQHPGHRKLPLPPAGRL